MDLNTVSQLVGSVGFPIAACCVMWYQNGKMQETLANISSTMTVLTSKITDIERKMDEDQS